MKIILREDVNGKGSAGDVIDVKTGYARNYLIPQNLAYMANDANTKVYEMEKVRKGKELEQRKTESEKLKTEIEKISLTAVAKVGDDGKLFGSITSHTISELLKEKGYDYNHRKIIIAEPIKELGVFEAEVDIFQDVKATVKVWVVRE
ncbi:50S ribosomal protein L9 [Candidatus Latescibacterota bacterium]